MDNTCPVCSRPTTEVYCELHRTLGTASNVIRRDVDRALLATSNSTQTRRALDLYASMSEEGKLGISLLCAALQKQWQRRAVKRGQRKTGIDSVATLELITALVMAESFEKG